MTDLREDEGPSHRLEDYFELLAALGRRGALSGGVGSWVDLLRRIEQARDGWKEDMACDTNLHARYLEYLVWGSVLEDVVLAERNEEIAAAIHRVAKREARELLGIVEPVLEIFCPERHHAALLPAPAGASFEEVVVLRQLRNARGRGTAAALHSALRATIAFANELKDSQQAGHPKCVNPYPILASGMILVASLRETMPYPYRLALAWLVQQEYLELFAPDQPTPERLYEAPLLPRGEHSLALYSPTWTCVAALLPGEDAFDRGPSPWLVEAGENAVHGYLELRREERREAEQARLVERGGQARRGQGRQPNRA